MKSGHLRNTKTEKTGTQAELKKLNKMMNKIKSEIQAKKKPSLIIVLVLMNNLNNLLNRTMIIVTAKITKAHLQRLTRKKPLQILYLIQQLIRTVQVVLYHPAVTAQKVIISLT